MACNLKPPCDFFFGFLWCSLPTDTIDVELNVRTFQGIHTFLKEHTTETATYTLWNRQMKPFPSLQKKMEAYKEEKKEKKIAHYILPLPV